MNRSFDFVIQTMWYHKSNNKCKNAADSLFMQAWTRFNNSNIKLYSSVKVNTDLENEQALGKHVLAHRPTCW